MDFRPFKDQNEDLGEGQADKLLRMGIRWCVLEN